MAVHPLPSLGSLSDHREVIAPLTSVVVTYSAADLSVEALSPTPHLSQTPQDLITAGAQWYAIRPRPDQELQALWDLGIQRKILKKLRAWHEWDKNRRRSPTKYILSCIYSTRTPCPSHAELLALATFFFPPRAKLTATICDFSCKSGVGLCETSSVPLFQAYKCRS